MSHEARALCWAKRVWAETPRPETEIELGAARVARRFAAKRAPSSRRAWRIAGAASAVLGAIGYASVGARHDPRPSSRLGVVPSELPTIASVTAPHDQATDEDTARVPADGQSGRGSAARASDSLVGGRSAPGDGLMGGRSAPAGGAPKGNIAGEPRSPGEKRPGPQNGQRVSPSPRSASDIASTEIAWIDVNHALAAGDYTLAEKLLVELASVRHDTNTRAKAHLGLAQLGEARNDCASARAHALFAASIPDIEIKTVRRALQLAARCTE